MKRIAIAILAVLAFASCDRNMSIPPNSEMLILVENRFGDNLLDPAFYGNIIDDGISISYNGETIDLGARDGEMYFRFETHDDPKLNSLMFGHFLVHDDTLKTFVINWGDGTSDQVTFEWHYGKKDLVYNVWVNGESQSTASHMMVKIIK